MNPRIFFRPALLLAMALSGVASAADITVTTTSDVLDAAATAPAVTLASLPGPDGQTSLREAIAAANSNPGADRIFFSVNGTFALTGAANEDNGSGGDFDVKQSVHIRGNGVANTIIDGGGIERIFDVFPSASSTFGISDLTIRNGDTRSTSFKEGGAMYLHNNVSTTIDNCRIVNNFSGANGAIENRGNLTINNSEISGNQTIPAAGNVVGGGIHNAGTLSIDRTTISNNIVRGEGGGIATSTAAGIFVRIFNSTISGNQARVTGGGNGHGGGISTTGNQGVLTISNSTISGNQADNNGGGAYFITPAGGTGSVILTNVTVTSNQANSDLIPSGTGGGFAQNTSAVTLRGTIVAGNTVSGTATASDISGAVVSSSNHNLIGVVEGSSGITNGVNNNIVGTSATPVNPQLGPLANNGGPTWTHALLTGSPAIDKGSNTAAFVSDQRGQQRVYDDPDVPNASDGSDIGAYEVQSPLPTVTASTAALAPNATQVTINGTNFDSTPSNNTVALSSGTATVMVYTSNPSLTLNFNTPPTAGPLTAVVTTPAGNSGAPVQIATVGVIVTADTSNLSSSATSMTINGYGFSPTAANNTVTFSGGATGTVSASTSTSLTVSGITGLTSGNLTAVVTTNGVSSGAAVQVATVRPTVTASTAGLNINSTSLTINGSGFSPTAANNTVLLSGGATGTVSSATQTSLQITGITGLANGPLTAVVTSNGVGSGADVQVATVFTTPNLTINDVTTLEGNSGTTTLAFTVSLSAPAPPGGVGFNIATQDGTATAPSDYVSQSLTGQTIAAGGSIYTFNVTINGDTVFEPNETFFVNVTNVSNATVMDSQGQGTITNDDAAVPEIAVLAPNNLVNGSATIDFGIIGTSFPVIRTVTIQNTGSANLTGLALSGSGDAAFTVGTLGATSLAPGASTSFNVTLASTTEGSFSASLQIASNDADENPFQIALSGSVVVATGRMVEVESNDTPATANPLLLTPGGFVKVKGDLWMESAGNRGGDVDYYAFHASAGDRIYAATMTSAAITLPTHDSVLTLLRPDGTTVIETDDDNGSFNASSSSIAGAVIPEDGLYYLRINDGDAARAMCYYELYVQVRSGTPVPEVEPNNNLGESSPAGNWIAGNKIASEADYFSVTLNAGDTVFLSLDLDPERDGGWNGRFGLGPFGNAGTVLAVNDTTADGGPPSEAFFMTVKEAGTYHVLVDSLDPASVGSYHLNISVLPAIVETTRVYSSTTSVPLADLSLSTSTITIPDNVRIGKLRVSIDLTHAFMADLDVHLRGPEGNVIPVFTDIGSSTPGVNTDMDITFSDDAAIPPSFAVTAGMIVKPEAASRNEWWKGANAGGQWTLEIRDDTAADVGTLHGWSIEIVEQETPSAGETIFSTDFESGAAGFTHSGTVDEWELGTPATMAATTTNPNAAFTTANSGVNCWKTDLDNTYNTNSNQDLLSPHIDLSSFSGRKLLLNWAQKYQIENANFDRAFVQVEEVGGTYSRRVWEHKAPTMTDNLAGGSAGVNHPITTPWTLVHQDISDFAGKVIQVRFHFESDSTVNLSGWAIDDFSVTAAGNPEIAVSGNGTAIADGETSTSSSDHTDFGTVSVSSGTVVRTFTIDNNGITPLTLGMISVGGTDVGDFTVSSQPASPVAAGDSTTFQVTFDPSAPGVREATISFTTNDPAAPTFDFAISGTGRNVVSIAASQASANEQNSGTTSFGFTVSRAGSTSAALTVSYAVTGSGSNPANAADFGGTLPAGTVEIPAGQSSANFSILATGDTMVERNEEFTVTISDSGSTFDLGTSTAISTITNDDTATVSIVTINNGAEGTPTPGLFRITQSVASSTDTLINYSIGGSASNGPDYGALSGSVVLPSGNTSVDIPITVINDFTVEPQEDVILTLGGTTNSSITTGSPSSATVTITDDAPTSIVVSSGANQSAVVGTTFGTSLVAMVTNSAGDGLAGASVTFTAPSIGASGTFGSGATVTTNASGLATAPVFTANNSAGTYSVVASTTGVASPANFVLNNTSGTAASFVFTAPSTATAGVPVSVTVSARDAFGNVATGYSGTVQFSSTDTAATLPANSTLTNGSGTFNVTFANGGNQTVTATDSVASSVTGTSGAVTVAPRADLAIAVSDSPDPVDAGSNLTYTVTVTNNGPSTAANVAVSIPVPTNTTWVSFTSPAGWSSVNNPPSASIGSLASGASAVFTLVVKVDYVVNGATIANQATVSSDTADAISSNNSVTTTTTVSAIPEIAVYNGATVSDPELTDGQGTAVNFGSTTVGNPITRSFTIRNVGTGSLSLTSLTPPAGFSLTSTFSPLSVAPTASFTFAVRYDAPSVGTSSGNVSIGSNDLDENPFDIPVSGTRANVAPVANGQSVSVDEDEEASITLTGSDSDSDALTYGIVTGPGNGSVDLSGSVVTYTPNPNFNGTDSFTFKVNDGTVDSAPATVSITVDAVNDAPVLASGIADVVQVTPGNITVIDLATYFTDVETASASLTYAVSAPDTSFFTADISGSVLTITSTGSGVTNLTVTASDSEPLSANDVFEFRVKSVPQTANGGIPDTIVSPAAPDQTFDLASYFSDADLDALTYTVLGNSDPGKATATIAPGSSSIRLQPVSSGNTTVTIRVTDSDGNIVDDAFLVTVEDPIPELDPTAGAPPRFNVQTGLYEISVTATNNNQLPIPGFRLRVTSALPAGIVLHNATSPAGTVSPYLDILSTLAQGESMVVVLEFRSPSRNFTGFDPTIIAEPLPPGINDGGTGAGVQVDLVRMLPDNGGFLIEFHAIKGRTYQIEYSNDGMTTWRKSLVPIIAGGNRVQWIDRGQPYTNAPPHTVPSRFYRVSQID